MFFRLQPSALQRIFYHRIVQLGSSKYSVMSQNCPKLRSQWYQVCLALPTLHGHAWSCYIWSYRKLFDFRSPYAINQMPSSLTLKTFCNWVIVRKTCYSWPRRHMQARNCFATPNLQKQQNCHFWTVISHEHCALVEMNQNDHEIWMESYTSLVFKTSCGLFIRSVTKKLWLFQYAKVILRGNFALSGLLLCIARVNPSEWF